MRKKRGKKKRKGIDLLRGVNEPPSSDKHEYPLCWTEEEMHEYCRMYEWLTFKDQKLGCAMCKAFRHFGPLGEVWGVRKWSKNEIRASGETQIQQQKSLMRKIKTHYANASHVAAVFWIRYQKTKGVNIILKPFPRLEKVKISRVKVHAPQDLEQDSTKNSRVMDSRKVKEVEALDLEEQAWPKCWTEKQKNRYCKKNEWLDFKEQKLGCKLCATYSDLAQQTKPPTKWYLANEMWVNYEITYDGEETRHLEKLLASLMKEIDRHKSSILHATAVFWIRDHEFNAMSMITQREDSQIDSDQDSMESGGVMDRGEKEKLVKQTVLEEDLQMKMISLQRDMCGKLDLLIDGINRLVKITEENGREERKLWNVNAEEMRQLRDSLNKRSLSVDDSTAIINHKKIKLEL